MIHEGWPLGRAFWFGGRVNEGKEPISQSVRDLLRTIIAEQDSLRITASLGNPGTEE